MTEDFGPITVTEAVKNEDGKVVVPRSDNTKHLTWVKAMWEANPEKWIGIQVPTGPIFPNTRQVKDPADPSGNTMKTVRQTKGKLGRGQDEYADAQNFIKAGKELGLHVVVHYRHNSPNDNGDRTTAFNVLIQPKRESDAATTQRRLVALAKGRFTKAEETYRVAKAAAEANPGDEALQAVAKRAATNYTNAKKKIQGNGGNGRKTTTTTK